MARREITQYFDDLDNQPLTAEQVNVVEFALEGTAYSIDLSVENRQKLEEALKPFIAVSRRVVRPKSGRGSTTRSSATPERNRAIRKWAEEKGISVSSRGRISQDVVDAYDAAHS